MGRLTPFILVILGLGLGFVMIREGAGQSDGVTPGAVEGSVGNAFTYQGRLSFGDAPAEGSYDLRFALYGSADGNDQIGSAVTVEDEAVKEGLFSVLLDFGVGAFDGSARWLEIAVREGDSEGAYSTLAPRQRLTAAPQALHAVEAGSIEWTDVQNRPPGLDDGDDNTTYHTGAGLVLSDGVLSAQGSPYANVLVVAQSGGDFSSVQEALDEITDASASNPYLLYIAPGVYEEQIALKPYVTLEGAGEGATVLRWLGGSDAPSSGSVSATMVGADNAAVRHLTVESDGTGQTAAVAIHNDGVSPRFAHVTAHAWGAGSYNVAVFNGNGSSSELSYVTTVSEDGTYSYGVYNFYSGVVTMSDVTVRSSTGSFTRAVYNNGSAPLMSKVNTTAVDGSSNYGVYNSNAAAPRMTNVIATGTGGSSAYGVYNHNSSPTIQYSVIEGSTNSIVRSGGGSVNVAHSQLLGAVGSGVNCFFNYDENVSGISC